MKSSTRDAVLAFRLVKSNNINELENLVSKNYKLVNETVDEDEKSLLHYACAYTATNNLELIKLLCENGANINHKSTDGKTALLWATTADNRAAVSFLADLGVDLNVQDKNGFTALHIACSNGYTELAMLLFELGTDYMLPEKNGLTALDLVEDVTVKEDLTDLWVNVPIFLNDPFYSRYFNMSELGMLQLFSIAADMVLQTHIPTFRRALNIVAKCLHTEEDTTTTNNNGGGGGGGGSTITTTNTNGIDDGYQLEKDKILMKLSLPTEQIWSTISDSVQECLMDDYVLQYLDLHENFLGKEGVNTIAAALKENSTMTKLNLSTCGAGSEGSKSISRALEVNNTLLALDLSYNAVTDDGAYRISGALLRNSTLKTLNLASNIITAEGIQFLCKGLLENFTVTTLSLAGNGSMGVKGLLDICYVLEKKNILTALNLSAVPFGDEGAQHIATTLLGNKSLTHLNISNCGITRVGTLAICNSLLKCTNLLHLDFSGNNIEIFGAKKFADVIRLNRHLKTLNLLDCGVESEGALAIVTSLLRNSVLTTLRVGYGIDVSTVTYPPYWRLTEEYLLAENVDIICLLIQARPDLLIALNDCSDNNSNAGNQNNLKTNQKSYNKKTNPELNIFELEEVDENDNNNKFNYPYAVLGSCNGRSQDIINSQQTSIDNMNSNLDQTANNKNNSNNNDHQNVLPVHPTILSAVINLASLTDIRKLFFDLTYESTLKYSQLRSESRRAGSTSSNCTSTSANTTTDSVTSTSTSTNPSATPRTSIFDLFQHAFWFEFVRHEEHRESIISVLTERPELLELIEPSSGLHILEIIHPCMLDISIKQLLIYRRFSLLKERPISNSLIDGCFKEIYAVQDRSNIINASKINKSYHNVVLKFYTERTPFLKEIEMRSKYHMSTELFLPFYSVPTDQFSGVLEDVDNGYKRINPLRADKFRYCLAYPAALGSLLDCMLTKDLTDISQLAEIMRVLGTAIVALHQQNLVHTAITPSHFLYFSTTNANTISTNSSKYDWKLTGLLYAAYNTDSSGNELSLLSTVEALHNNDTNNKSTTPTLLSEYLCNRNSTCYCPPESFHMNEYTGQVILKSKDNSHIYEGFAADTSFDSWSFGMILYKLITLLEYGNPDSIFTENVHGELSIIGLRNLVKWNLDSLHRILVPIKNKIVKDMIFQLLQPDPVHRPTVREMLKSSFFTSSAVATNYHYSGGNNTNQLVTSNNSNISYQSNRFTKYHHNQLIAVTDSKNNNNNNNSSNNSIRNSSNNIENDIQLSHKILNYLYTKKFQLFPSLSSSEYPSTFMIQKQPFHRKENKENEIFQYLDELNAIFKLFDSDTNNKENNLDTKINKLFHDGAYVYLLCDGCFEPQPDDIWPALLTDGMSVRLLLPLLRNILSVIGANNNIRELGHTFGFHTPHFPASYDQRVDSAEQSFDDVDDNEDANNGASSNMKNKKDAINYSENFECFESFIKKIDNYNQWGNLSPFSYFPQIQHKTSTDGCTAWLCPACYQYLGDAADRVELANFKDPTWTANGVLQIASDVLEVAEDTNEGMFCISDDSTESNHMMMRNTRDGDYETETEAPVDAGSGVREVATLLEEEEVEAEAEAEADIPLRPPAAPIPATIPMASPGSFRNVPNSNSSVISVNRGPGSTTSTPSKYSIPEAYYQSAPVSVANSSPPPLPATASLSLSKSSSIPTKEGKKLAPPDTLPPPPPIPTTSSTSTGYVESIYNTSSPDSGRSRLSKPGSTTSPPLPSPQTTSPASATSSSIARNNSPRSKEMIGPLSMGTNHSLMVRSTGEGGGSSRGSGLDDVRYRGDESSSIRHSSHTKDRDDQREYSNYTNRHSPPVPAATGNKAKHQAAASNNNNRDTIATHQPYQSNAASASPNGLYGIESTDSPSHSAYQSSTGMPSSDHAAAYYYTSSRHSEGTTHSYEPSTASTTTKMLPLRRAVSHTPQLKPPTSMHLPPASGSHPNHPSQTSSAAGPRSAPSNYNPLPPPPHPAERWTSGSSGGFHRRQQPSQSSFLNYQKYPKDRSTDPSHPSGHSPPRVAFKDASHDNLVSFNSSYTGHYSEEHPPSPSRSFPPRDQRYESPPSQSQSKSQALHSNSSSPSLSQIHSERNEYHNNKLLQHRQSNEVVERQLLRSGRARSPTISRNSRNSNHQPSNSGESSHSSNSSAREGGSQPNNDMTRNVNRISTTSNASASSFNDDFPMGTASAGLSSRPSRESAKLAYLEYTQAISSSHNSRKSPNVSRMPQRRSPNTSIDYSTATVTAIRGRDLHTSSSIRGSQNNYSNHQIMRPYNNNNNNNNNNSLGQSDHLYSYTTNTTPYHATEYRAFPSSSHSGGAGLRHPTDTQSSTQREGNNRKKVELKSKIESFINKAQKTSQWRPPNIFRFDQPSK